MDRTGVVRYYCAVGLLVIIGVLFLPVVDCFPPRPTDPSAAACSDQQHINLVVASSSQDEPYQRRPSLFLSTQQQRRRFGSHTTAAFAVKSSSSNSSSNISKNNNPEQLHFISEIHVVSSEPLPTTDRAQVDAFLASTTCRNHFLSGGGTNVIRDEPRTPELEACWRRACELHYGTLYLPAPDDPVVSTETSIQFPGLRLVNRVFSGVKFVDAEETTVRSRRRGKEYHTLLIAEQRQAMGPAPLVWLYNQLTGGESKRIKQQQQSITEGIPSDGELETSSSKSSNSRTGEASGYAISRIYIMEERPDSDGTAAAGEYYYKIGFECTVEVMVQFPRLLLKLLPVSKEKMEQQGSLSVKKAVEKDILKAIESTTQAFDEWKATTTSAASTV